MTGPDRIWIDRHGGNWSPMDGGTQDTEYIRRDPAVLAALPEVQALIAAAIENAARRYRFGGGVHGDYPMWRYSDAAEKVIRAVAPADATAALARIEREAEARGMVKGMREAADALIPTRGATLPYQQAAILARAAEIEKDAK